MYFDRVCYAITKSSTLGPYPDIVSLSLEPILVEEVTGALEKMCVFQGNLT